MFIRESKIFLENFSIGLNVIIDGEEIALRRFNGRHGPTEAHPHHIEFHSHSPLWKNGERSIKSLKAISKEEYVSFHDALTVVCNRCKIEGMEAYFPSLEQPELGFDND